ncbi:hypothetical protein F4859DRAFT_509796 [Xylaria cf. heliscus]|nr:hypothetical protein F4859DRAFT_509796 [Xylaria cf. heliscus]
MAALRDRPYRHLGVLIPFSALGDDDQWSSEANIEREDDDDGPHWVPEEMRISTAPRAARRLPAPGIVRGRTRIYFNELDLWQDFGFGVHSLYIKHYNGGSLYAFLRSYQRRRREIPEHFIWHVLLTLIEAVRYLKFGALPGTDDEDPNWIAIHHRDIATRNVFIHYLPRDDPEPDEGFEENAFPELILGDFGHAASENDDLTMVKNGRWDQRGVIAEWHDVYGIFDVAKELCTQVKHSIVGTVNQDLRENERPYSDDLIEMLEHFEYPNCDTEHDIRDSQLDPVSGLQEPNYSGIPNMRRVVDEFLPIIRDRVQRYRNPAGGIPDRWWRQLDVSWTKPDPFMPYEWMTQGLPNANEVGNNGGEGGYKDKGKGKEYDGNNNNNNNMEDEDDDKENDNASVELGHTHSCPKPNPVSAREMLNDIVQLEVDYDEERPAHQIMQLEYERPIMSEIRSPPPPPAPAMPAASQPTP